MLPFNEKECLEPLIILIGIYGCDPPNGTHFEKWEGEHDPKETSEGLQDTILWYWSKELGTKATFTFPTFKINHPFMTPWLVLELGFHEQRLKIKFDP